MSPKLYAALDIGTTHIKAILTDAKMNIVSQAVMRNPAQTPSLIGLCYDADMVFDKAAAALHQALSGVSKKDVAALGVTGMADSGLMVSADGRPLTSVIPWSNSAGSEYLQDILHAYPLEKLYEITGHVLHPKFALCRLFYHRSHTPEAFAHAAYWLSLYDYLLYRLTGHFVTDRSIACRTMLFNINSLSYCDELLNLTGLGRRVPDLIDIGETAGHITPAAARATGLMEDTPVYSGGHDHPLALDALIQSGFGTWLNSLGTAEVLIGQLDAALPPHAARIGVQQGLLSGGRRYCLANLPSCGASLEWLRSLVSLNGEVDYAYFIDNAVEDADGVLYLPHLNGSGTPEPDPLRRGAFSGLSMKTGVHQMYRAMVEGIAFETKRIFLALEALKITVPQAIIASGGGVRNHPLIKAKADITGRTYLPAAMPELTALGAALIAAKGQGETNLKLPVALSSVTPDENKQYASRFDDYLMLAQALKPGQTKEGYP